ncbi:MAG: thiamine diphosphokinase [Acidimicrobiales bacterium]|nr:thiamine diphosphokinase [Acidimicrobiales bacterium]
MDADAALDQPITLVAIGGDPAAPFVPPRSLPAGSVVVAADSGLDHLVRHGIAAHHVVGDLDSVAASSLERARRDGARIHAHPSDKDATDLELALDLVLALVSGGAPPRLLVVGPGAGRLDLLLGDALLLSSPKLATLEVSARIGPSALTVVRPGVPRRIVATTGRAGEQVSILPVHGPARGVTSAGLRWALTDADLAPGTTRGLSNELVAAAAEVRLGDGVLVVVQPGSIAGAIAPRATPYDPTPRLPEPGRPDDPTPGDDR